MHDMQLWILASPTKWPKYLSVLPKSSLRGNHLLYYFSTFAVKMLLPTTITTITTTITTIITIITTVLPQLVITKVSTKPHSPLESSTLASMAITGQDSHASHAQR